MQHQMGFAASVLMARGLVDAKGKLPPEFVHEALKEVVMHEVGHTLGLRHNFKASAWKDLKDVDDRKKHPNEPIVASVMDYNPDQYRAGRHAAGLLLHSHDRPLRLLGDRIWLQGNLRQRVGRARKNRLPRGRSGLAIRDR